MNPSHQSAVLALLLGLLVQPAAAQGVTEQDFLETGAPLTFPVGGKIGLLITKDLKGLCSVTLIDDLGDWLFGEKPPLMFSAFDGEQCQRLWRLAWDARSQSNPQPAQALPQTPPSQGSPAEPAGNAEDLKKRLNAGWPYVRWAPVNEYSDTFLYNGFKYKTIQFSNFFLAVAQPTPKRLGFRNYVTFANVLLENRADHRLDIDPASFLLQCDGADKGKTLKYYLPEGTESHSALFRSQTLFKDDEMKGVVAFRGNCAKGVVQIPIGKAIFEFPFP